MDTIKLLTKPKKLKFVPKIILTHKKVPEKLSNLRTMLWVIVLASLPSAQKPWLHRQLTEVEGQLAGVGVVEQVLDSDRSDSVEHHACLPLLLHGAGEERPTEERRHRRRQREPGADSGGVLRAKRPPPPPRGSGGGV